MKSRKFARVGLLAVLLTLAACAAAGPVDGPARNLTWFNYASGGDLRAICAPGAPDTLRFVYNGIYDRQIRAYDLTGRTDGSARLLARARGVAGNLRQLSLSQPLGPWELRRSEIDLPTADVARLRAALAADAAAAPAAAGQRLDSNEFYWLVSGCEAGRFTISAFRDAKVPHAGLAFPEVLLALDQTEVPFRAAKRVEGKGGGDTEFQLHINRTGDGLAGPVLAF